MKGAHDKRCKNQKFCQRAKQKFKDRSQLRRTRVCVYMLRTDASSPRKCGDLRYEKKKLRSGAGSDT